MATSRPRITVTLTDEIMDKLTRYSDATGDSVSSIVFSMLHANLNVIRLATDLVLSKGNERDIIVPSRSRWGKVATPRK